MKNLCFFIFVWCFAVISQAQQIPVSSAGVMLGANKLPIFQFPTRQKDAITGSQFASQVMGLTAEERDSVVYKEIAQGNIPDSFRQSVYLVDSLQDADGNMHSVVLNVLPRQPKTTAR